MSSTEFTAWVVRSLVLALPRCSRIGPARGPHSAPRFLLLGFTGCWLTVTNTFTARSSPCRRRSPAPALTAWPADRRHPLAMADRIWLTGAAVRLARDLSAPGA